MASSKVLALDDATFKDAVAKEKLPVVVDFWAPWCSPCRAMAPIVDQLAEEMAELARFAKVDIQQSPGVAGQYGVMSIPTFVVLKGGQKAGEVVGAVANKAEFRRKLEALIKA